MTSMMTDTVTRVDYPVFHKIPLKAVMVSLPEHGEGRLYVKDVSGEVTDMPLDIKAIGIMARLMEPEEFVALGNAMAVQGKWTKVSYSE